MNMADRVREVGRGDPVRADQWNILARLGNDWARERSRLGGGPVRSLVADPSLTVFVRNDTGGDLPAFTPIRLDATFTGIAASPRDDIESRDRPCFRGFECGGASAHGVLLQALPEDEIGLAVVGGVCVARVSAGVTTVGQWVTPPVSGNVELELGGLWGRVVATPVGTGDRVALVQIVDAGMRQVLTTTFSGSVTSEQTLATVQYRQARELVRFTVSGRVGASATINPSSPTVHDLLTEFRFVRRLASGGAETTEATRVVGQIDVSPSGLVSNYNQFDYFSITQTVSGAASGSPGALMEAVLRVQNVTLVNMTAPAAAVTIQADLLRV